MKKILEIDDFLLYKLEKVACPTLNFVDLSTFDQLSDVLGYVPYLENGNIYYYKGNRIKTYYYTFKSYIQYEYIIYIYIVLSTNLVIFQ